jgi:hypothetical protein
MRRRPRIRTPNRGSVGLRLIPLVVLAIVASAGSDVAIAADAAAASPPESCADRYPAEGPAGLDLRLGCIAGELVGHVTGSSPSREPAPISSYLAPLVAILGSLAVIVLLAVILRRRLGRRLAPVMPGTWWSCPACRSVNAVGTSLCYACGAPFEPSAVRLETD